MPLHLAKSVILVSVRISGLGAPTILDSTTVNSIAQSIQQQEGYYPGSLAYINNNPGNLIYAGQSGATRGANGYAAFSSYSAGYQALLNQIQLYASRGMTIQDMMNVYAPAGQGSNDPVAYAQTIAQSVGASPGTPLVSLDSPFSSPSTEFAAASLDPSFGSPPWGGLGAVAAIALIGILLSR